MLCAPLSLFKERPSRVFCGKEKDNIMNENIKSPAIDRLFRAVLTLETVEDCYDFFDDLCTIPELLEMAKRMTAASMLADGKKYAEVAAETGLSTATISRVNRCLKYGNGGYKKALGGLCE